MTTSEFLRKKNIITENEVDLLLGFSDGTKESLGGLLEEYHREKMKKL